MPDEQTPPPPRDPLLDAALGHFLTAREAIDHGLRALDALRQRSASLAAVREASQVSREKPGRDPNQPPPTLGARRRATESQSTRPQESTDGKQAH